MADVGGITYLGTIERITCGNCGIIFGLPIEFKQRRVEDGRKFYCPNGCHVGWGDQCQTEQQRLRNQLAAARAREDQLGASLASSRSMLSHERARVRGLKGVVTRTKKRIGHGVCPCCSRTFQDVARHMATKHPGYSGEVEP